MTQARTKKDESAVAAAPVADAPVKAAPVKKTKTSTPKKESEHPPYKVPYTSPLQIDVVVADGGKMDP
jgi:hypothetical protein